MPKDHLPSSLNSSVVAANPILEDDAIMADTGYSESTTITTKFPFLSLNNSLRQNVFSFFSLAERARLVLVSTTTKQDIEILSEKFFDSDKNELIKLLCSRLAENLPLKQNSEGFLKRLYELSLHIETKNFEKITILLYLIKYRQQYPAAFTAAQYEPERLLQELVFYCDDDNYVYVSLKLAELLANKKRYKTHLKNVIHAVMNKVGGDLELEIESQALSEFFPLLDNFLSIYNFNTSSTIVHEFIRTYLQNNINEYQLDKIYDENERDLLREADDAGHDEEYISKCGPYLDIKEFDFLWSQWTGVNHSEAYLIIASALDNMNGPSQSALYLERLCQRFIKINDRIENIIEFNREIDKFKMEQMLFYGNPTERLEIALRRHMGEFALIAKYLYDIPMHYLEQIVAILKNILELATNANNLAGVDGNAFCLHTLHDFIVYLIKSISNIKGRLDAEAKIKLISSISDEIINFAIKLPDNPNRYSYINSSTTAFERNKLIFDSQIISKSQRERLQPILKSSLEKENESILWAFSYKNVQANDKDIPVVSDENICSKKELDKWKQILPLIATYLSAKQISYCLKDIYPHDDRDSYKENLALLFNFMSSLSQAQRENLLKEIVEQIHASIHIKPDGTNFYYFNQALPSPEFGQYSRIDELLVNYNILCYYLYYFSNSIDESRSIFSAIIDCHINKINLNEDAVSSDNAEPLAKPERLFIDTETTIILKNTDNYQNTIKAEQKSYLVSALLPLVENNHNLLTRIMACTFLVKFSAALSDNQINQLIHTILEDSAFPTKFALMVLPKLINKYFTSSHQLILAERLNYFTIKSYQDLALYSDALYSLETLNSLRSDINLHLLKLKVDQFLIKENKLEDIAKDVASRYISSNLLTTINSKMTFYSEISTLFHALHGSQKRKVEKKDLVNDRPAKKLKPF